jgi:1-acyl-sn-glycerol-3-phosphate acyltransferase
MLTMAARRMLGFMIKELLLAIVRVSTGVRSVGLQPARTTGQQVYFANHTSIADFLLIWTVMPPELRRTTRTVAAADYWNASWLRRFLAREVFNAVLISRACKPGQPSALEVMTEALRRGESLIIFPEGTRNTSGDWLTPFKPGLYHIACEYPSVQFIPVWLDKIREVLPKGMWLPVPMDCTVHVGLPLPLNPAEKVEAFLKRAQDAVLALRPCEGEATVC